MEGGVQLKDPNSRGRPCGQSPRVHIPGCIQLRAESGRQRGQERLATERSPANWPKGKPDQPLAVPLSCLLQSSRCASAGGPGRPRQRHPPARSPEGRGHQGTG